LPGWGGPGKVVAALSQSTRTLALLTRVRGAKRGASNRRSRAASGYIQPLPRRPNGTSGDTWHHQATLRKCLLSSRSRVRVAVGAHSLNPRSGDIFTGPRRAVTKPVQYAKAGVPLYLLVDQELGRWTLFGLAEGWQRYQMAAGGAYGEEINLPAPLNFSVTAAGWPRWK
jgi:hypothetical protein